MELLKIKEEMKKYRDLYGGELLNHNDIDDCKSLLDCERIIERHRDHISAMLSDAESHLDNFKRRVGVY
ncbi:MAG TPA: hypothetical protein VIK55_06785 [Paludibacter sp.]